VNDLQAWLCSGILREDAQLKFTPGGYPVCNFELFSHRTYTVKDVVREENLTASCTILGDLGKNVAPQLKAGVKVFVRGRWRLNEWTDQKTGQPRKRHVVTVDEVDVLGTTVLPIQGMGAQAAEPDADGLGMPF